MQTESIAATLRPRDGWEAVDLGFRLVRTWWWPVFAPFVLVVWPLAAAICWMLSDQLAIAVVILWWGKPLYDRIALFVLSEALFGHVPSVRETLETLPSQLRNGTVAGQLWLRLSPQRALHLPVVQLEHLGGRARTARARLLAGRESRVAMGLHVTCFMFELAVFIGLVQFVALFAPEETGVDLIAILGGDAYAEVGWLLPALYVIALTLVEPFYVGGGFGLYINRRVYLEGWDIDLAFRRLARRLAPTGALVLALACGLPAITSAEPAEAEGAPVECEARAEGATECIEQVLAAPEFATTREIEYWWPRGLDSEESAVEGELPGGFLFEMAQLFAALLRYGAYIALVIVLAWLALQIARRRSASSRPTRATPGAGEVQMGRDPAAAPLPVDPVAGARALWGQGDPTGALSLLYRGALAHLVGEVGLELPSSATEGECERITRRRADAELAADFSALTRAWQYAAYGKQPPADSAFAALCNAWSERLGAAA